MAEPIICELKGFPKGLVKSVDHTALEKEELVEAHNVVIDHRGDVRRRCGFSRADDGVATPPELTSIVSWWPDADSEYEWLVGTGPATVNVYVDRDASEPFALDTLSAGANTSPYLTSYRRYWTTHFVSLNSSDLYMVRHRGGDSPRKITYVDDVTAPTITTLTKADFSVADDDSGTPANQFPMGRYAVTKHSRVWVANVRYASGVVYSSRLHYSDLLSPEIWYGLDYFDFDPDDGQEITALAAYGESLIVFKNHNVQILTGKSPDSFARTVLDENVGTVSPNSVAVEGGTMMFFDRDRGVWSFDGAQFTDISENIRDYLLDGINWDKAFTAGGFLRRGVYYLSVPWGTDTVPSRTFVFDLSGELWYEWDMGFASKADRGGDTFGGAVNSGDGFFHMFEGDDDDGTAIEAYVETGWLSPAGGGSIHKVRRLDASFADMGASEQVQIDGYMDYSDTVAATATVTPDNGDLFQRVGGFGKKRWHQLKLKVSNVAGSDFRLNLLSLRAMVSRRGRGVDDV